MQCKFLPLDSLPSLLQGIPDHSWEICIQRHCHLLRRNLSFRRAFHHFWRICCLLCKSLNCHARTFCCSKTNFSGIRCKSTYLSIVNLFIIQKDCHYIFNNSYFYFIRNVTSGKYKTAVLNLCKSSVLIINPPFCIMLVILSRRSHINIVCRRCIAQHHAIITAII